MTPFEKAPEWSKDAIWYQIFVERFYNGDRHNDPKADNINIESLGLLAPDNWTLNPWTGNWYHPERWEKGKPFSETLQYRRYGGDLQGVLDKLDYLQDLGITALYLNPVNDAPSAHKYDAASYHHIDINFGPDPEGDRMIIASEDPANPLTWKWTSADKLFLKLIREVHSRGMRIIVDYSWNHTGVNFWAWRDILEKQSLSAYHSWYDIRSFDGHPESPHEYIYSGWMGIKTLPELKKVNVSTPRVNGKPYEGDINEGAKQHILAVTRRWLAPEGNPEDGVDGFRLDVADQIGMSFWRDFRKEVRQIKQDTYLVGEVWWDEFPEKFMDIEPYTRGDIFDAVMLYHTYRPARYFFSDSAFRIDASEFRSCLEQIWSVLPPDKRQVMMNVSSTHDTPRLLTDFYNKNMYKLNATPFEDQLYHTGKPDRQTYKRVRHYLIHLFTSVGAPHIWNGEEMGMWGADDPDSRKPLWWEEFEFEDESRNNYQPGRALYDPVGFNRDHFSFYKKLISIRKSNPVLVKGEMIFTVSEGNKLAYKRVCEASEIMVCFNLDHDTQVFPLQKDSVYVNLLNGRKVRGENLSLASLGAVILKRV
ncbi:glycoside hydrolase family 13 protein [Flavihumibacter sp. R14]|nr:glycoside hydrolase family 13 protein [Flavihumibacter soli]